MKPNKNLKVIINEIVSHTQSGRWGIVTPGIKPVFEAAPPPPVPADDEKKDKGKGIKSDAEAVPPPPPPGGDVPPADKGGAPVPPPPEEGKPTEEPAVEEKPEDTAEKASEKASDASKEADKAKEEAEQAKEKAEKAKAEKDQAEQEIEQASYIKLNSKSGTAFLLNNILNDALARNKVSGLAQQFVDKLKIDSPEDLQNFQKDTVQFQALKGYKQLLQSMSTLLPPPTEEPAQEAPAEETPTV